MISCPEGRCLVYDKPSSMGKEPTMKTGVSFPKSQENAARERPYRNAGREKKRRAPRVWGRPRSTDRGLWESRNTPTRVGKTQRWPVALQAPEKHPHACGEDTSLFLGTKRTLETPPRVWGRLCPRLFVP